MKKTVKNKSGNIKVETALKLKIKFWTGLGSVVIFLSWASQNFFQEKWRSEIVRLERNKLAISFNEVNKNVYQTFLNSEQSHASADSMYNDNLELAYNAYVNYANLLQYLGVSISNDDVDFLKRNDSIFNENLKDIEMWQKNKQFKNIVDFATTLSEWEKNNSSNVINKYQTYIQQIRDKENFWNNAYLALYIIGAICLCRAFLLDYSSVKNK